MISTVYIAKNVYGGDGLGRLGDGRVVFVPGAWAGENVKAEIVEEKRTYVKARLVEVVEPSPERVDGGELRRIPGCVYANLAYAAEAKAKESQLREFFERARIAVESFGGVSAKNPLNYRNKVVYHFAKNKGKWEIGYRREPDHAIVEIESDPLATKEINAKLPEIRRGVVALLTQGAQAVRREVERKGDLTVRWSAKSGVKWWIGDPARDTIIRERTHGLDFEVPAGGFYQVNPEMGEELVKAVVAEYDKVRETAPEMLDLYCGVGVFGLACRPQKLTGVESGREAIEFAKKNAAVQKFANARFFAEQTGRSLKRLVVTDRTAIVVDPPRGGMEPNVPKFLAASAAPRIFYVSCDPATLTRDLRTLSRAYAVESVKWFDMFPRTARFETLVVLKKR